VEIFGDVGKLSHAQLRMPYCFIMFNKHVLNLNCRLSVTYNHTIQTEIII